MLKATLLGDKASNYKFTNDVKAITYNSMFVKKQKEEYILQVVLDV
jgi:SHS2 domain-containing protein